MELVELVYHGGKGAKVVLFAVTWANRTTLIKSTPKAWEGIGCPNTYCTSYDSCKRRCFYPGRPS